MPWCQFFNQGYLFCLNSKHIVKESLTHWHYSVFIPQCMNKVFPLNKIINGPCMLNLGWQPNEQVHYCPWASDRVRLSVAKVAGSPYLKVGVRRRWWVVVPPAPATWLSIWGPAQSIWIWIFNGGWWTVDGTVLSWKEGNKEEREDEMGLQNMSFQRKKSAHLSWCKPASWGYF